MSEEPLKLDTPAPTRGSAARRDAEFLHLRPGAEGSRRPKMGRWLVGMLLLLGVVGGLWWYRQGAVTAPSKTTISVTAPAPKATGTPPTNADTPLEQSVAAMGDDGENALDGALGLALQGISLFSGEKGAELWRLKASYAHLSREGSNIDVDLPVVRYTLGTPGEPGYEDDFLDVKADKGRVTDNQRYITLWGNVDVQRFDDTISGPRLNYDSATRIMVFPEGASMDNPDASGQAGLFTWDLGTNVMTGENGVTVIIKPKPDEPAVPEGQTLPEGAAASAVQKAPAAPVTPVIQKAPQGKTVQKIPQKKRKTGQAAQQSKKSQNSKKNREAPAATKPASSGKKPASVSSTPPPERS